MTLLKLQSLLTFSIFFLGFLFSTSTAQNDQRLDFQDDDLSDPADILTLDDIENLRSALEALAELRREREKVDRRESLEKILNKTQGYEVQDVEIILNGTRIQGMLSLKNLAHQDDDEDSEEASEFKMSLLKHLAFDIAILNSQVLKIFIKPLNRPVFEVPKNKYFPQEENLKDRSYIMKDFNISVIHNPFSITVIRISTNEVIFDTKNHRLIFMNTYTEFGITLPSRTVIGWGERASSLILPKGVFTLWSLDNFARKDHGGDERGGNQTYSVHPFLLFREQSKMWSAFFLNSANAVDGIWKNDHTFTVKTVRFVGALFPLDKSSQEM